MILDIDEHNRAGERLRRGLTWLRSVGGQRRLSEGEVCDESKGAHAKVLGQGRALNVCMTERTTVLAGAEGSRWGMGGSGAGAQRSASEARPALPEGRPHTAIMGE